MSSNVDEQFNEMKQSFLSSAITDISAYIQLADTKVSIIMGTLVALIAGILACYDPIIKVISNVSPCSWVGISIVIFSSLCLFSVIAVFVLGILTIRAHSSIINYKSKWYLPQSSQVYSFDEYRQDVVSMTKKDIIENMAAELYKLNDINRQKSKTMKWAIRFFSFALFTVSILGVLLLISTL